jgi:hypothetical protein
MLSNSAKDAMSMVCRVSMVLQLLYANALLRLLLVLKLDNLDVQPRVRFTSILTGYVAPRHISIYCIV